MNIIEKPNSLNIVEKHNPPTVAENVKYGIFYPITNFNDLQTFISDSGDVTQFKINKLTAEDGGGFRFLIDYDLPSAKSRGYIDFKTMRGFLRF